ncbi:MAG: DUF2961 domain-containing protein [Planctomycetota bacterium]
MLKYIFAILGLFLASALSVQAQEVTLPSLLREMIDRDQLARWPSPAYTCRQASSYDRASTDPGDVSTWFANGDHSHFIRTEQGGGREEHVLLDAEGPGAVVRFWATWRPRRGMPFSNGTLRFYFDGQGSPAIEGPISQVLDKGQLAAAPLGEGVSPLTEYDRRGHNLYFPIPYAKHCKITYSTDAPMSSREGEALYYQINYRTYADGTGVRTFEMKQLEEHRELIDQVQRRLAASGLAGDVPAQSLELAGEIAAGASKTGRTFKGPAAVRQIQLKIEAENLPQALRSTVLEISFDGGRTVWCPVGDFFGIGYQLRPTQTWYTRVDSDGTLACHWTMPFQKSCQITLHNVGREPVRVALAEAATGPWKWDDRAMLFHSTWHQLTDVATQTNAGAIGSAFDVNYVAITGRGVYAGDTLTLFNGGPRWWGEGDEKIFVDGEAFPSHFGTGTEDYYGYAWCRPEAFSSPLHSQPEGGGNLAGGFSVNNRYRALDAIPFTESLKFDMELWHWLPTRMNYAPATFFYARPGASTNVDPDPKAAAEKVAIKPAKPARPDPGPGVEGETLKLLDRTGGRTLVQRLPSAGWSGDKQLWWRDGAIGDKLVVGFPVEKEGRYQLAADLTKAGDYAIVQIGVNGQAAGKFDRYFGSVEYDRVDLGIFALKAGENKLEVEIVGNNPSAEKRQMFGLDFLSIKPAK